MNPINTLCWKNAEFLKAKACVIIVQKVNEIKDLSINF